MQNLYYQEIANSIGISIYTLLGFLVILGIWTVVWKGLALWKSARKSQPIWFIVFLVINTLGILEILYIFLFSKTKKTKKPKRKNKDIKGKFESKKLKRFINKNSLE